DSTLFFAAVPLLMALSGREKHSIWQTGLIVLGRVFTHPFIVATLLGILFAWLQIRPPAPVEKILDYLANAAAPCALLALGVTVALRRMEKIPDELPVLAAIKLLLHPAIAWVVLSLFGGFDPVWVYTAILMASLPSALNAFVMAKQYNVFVQQA